MNYDISIITPSFNQGKFIEQTIKSVLDQSIPNLQYLVIDGKSTDQTISILNKYNGQVDWLSEKDNGQSNALNKGFKKATGEIIGWLNSDDIYFSGTLATVLDFFKKNPNIDVLYGDAHHIDEKNKFIGKYPTEKWSLKSFFNHCFLSQPAVFFRSTLFEKFGFLDEELHFCIDYEFWLRLATGGANFYYLPKTLSATRLHSLAKTIASPIKAHEEQLSMIKRYQKYIPFRMVLAYAKASLQNKINNKIILLICVIGKSLFLSVKYNGFLHGVCDWFSMPKILYKYINTK